MSTLDRASPETGTEPFVPFALHLRDKPAGRFGQLWHLANNAIHIWAREHFEKIIVTGPSLIGETALVNDPAGIRRVLVDNVGNYEKDHLQLRILSAGAPENTAMGLLVATGEQWRRTRRTLAPLFAPRRVSALARAMHEQAQARVATWLAKSAGTGLRVDQEMTGVNYDILSATMFSGALEGGAQDAERELTIMLNSIGRIHPFDVLGAPDWLPRLGHGRGYKARRYFEAEMEKLLSKRQAEEARGAPLPDDLLSALLRASDPETGEGLTRQEITSNLFTFIAAGHETTARALTWTLYLL